MIDDQDVLPEAQLFSDAGTSENADLVQASRSIILHLKEDQELTLKKMVTTHSTASPDTETDKRLTFCISLNHLDAALELGNLPKFSSGVLLTFEYFRSFANQFDQVLSDCPGAMELHGSSFARFRQNQRHQTTGST